MTKSKSQNKPQILKYKIYFLICVFSFCAFRFAFCASAQEDLGKLKETYFKDNKYSEFVDYLKNLKKKSPSAAVSYYIALSRYRQLKYLEETQNWNEYFNFQDQYRQELTDELKNAIASVSPEQENITIYARILLWQFRKDQDDTQEYAAREDLMNAVINYASKTKDIEVVKYAADAFYGYGNKREAKILYDIYAKTLIESEMSPEKLKESASDAYKKENLALSAMIYDAYIERIKKTHPKEEIIAELKPLIEDFSFKDGAAYDCEYAERLFQRLEELGGKETLGEELRYLRAYNLEKAKEYLNAERYYNILAEGFPEGKYYDEAMYKIGMIATYALGDIDKGTAFFEKLSQKNQSSPQVISSLYQLGVLLQWQKNTEKAKEYYLKLIERAAGDYSDTQELAKQRLNEIENGKDMEYNLKMFLDATFSKEPVFDMSRLELSAAPFRVKDEQATEISSTANLPESGCMAVEIQYLWSGHLGKTIPAAEQPSFSTSYKFSGTKEVNLVAVTPSGVLDRSIIMVDAQ